MDTLEKLNAHPRDQYITFDEGPHIYTIKGNSDYTSVTTWNHMHFQHFDADLVIDKMMKGRNWNPGNKWYGKTKDEIKKAWEDLGTVASTEGTKMHYNIECYYNGVPVDEQGKNTTEFQYFLKFASDYSYLKPYRTEWMIYDEELKFAGSVDMLFKNADGTLEIYDWKRSKEIKMDNKYQSGITECVSHLPDCNFYHYSLQLNTYKAILEKNYGERISGLYLVCLHPNNPNNSYIRIQCADLSEEVKALFEYRKRMLRGEILESDEEDEGEDEGWLGSSSD